MNEERVRRLKGGRAYVVQERELFNEVSAGSDRSVDGRERSTHGVSPHEVC